MSRIIVQGDHQSPRLYISNQTLDDSVLEAASERGWKTETSKKVYQRLSMPIQVTQAYGAFGFPVLTVIRNDNDGQDISSFVEILNGFSDRTLPHAPEFQGLAILRTLTNYAISVKKRIEERCKEEGESVKLYLYPSGNVSKRMIAPHLSTSPPIVLFPRGFMFDYSGGNPIRR